MLLASCLYRLGTRAQLKSEMESGKHEIAIVVEIADQVLDRPPPPESLFHCIRHRRPALDLLQMNKDLILRRCRVAFFVPTPKQ